MENYRARDEDVDVWILQLLEGPQEAANVNDCLSGIYSYVLQCFAVTTTVNSQGSRPTHMPLIWHYLWLGTTFNYRASPVQVICLLPLLCRTQMMARYAVMEFTKIDT